MLPTSRAASVMDICTLEMGSGNISATPREITRAAFEFSAKYMLSAARIVLPAEPQIHAPTAHTMMGMIHRPIMYG